jgi:hypothetical protein
MLKAGEYHHSSSRSRRTASLAGFFDFSHVFDGPLRHGASVRFDTLPWDGSYSTASASTPALINLIHHHLGGFHRDGIPRP